MKTCPVENNLFLGDGQTWQTDMTTLIGACRYFGNAPKNGRWIQRVLLNYMVLHKKGNCVNTIPIYSQQDATLHSLLYLETALRVSSGTSIHHQERVQLYLCNL